MARVRYSNLDNFFLFKTLCIMHWTYLHICFHLNCPHSHPHHHINKKMKYIYGWHIWTCAKHSDLKWRKKVTCMRVIYINLNFLFVSCVATEQAFSNISMVFRDGGAKRINDISMFSKVNPDCPHFLFIIFEEKVVCVLIRWHLGFSSIL